MKCSWDLYGCGSGRWSCWRFLSIRHKYRRRMLIPLLRWPNHKVCWSDPHRCFERVKSWFLILKHFQILGFELNLLHGEPTFHGCNPRFGRNPGYFWVPAAASVFHPSLCRAHRCGHHVARIRYNDPRELTWDNHHCEFIKQRHFTSQTAGLRNQGYWSSFIQICNGWRLATAGECTRRRRFQHHVLMRWGSHPNNIWVCPKIKKFQNTQNTWLRNEGLLELGITCIHTNPFGYLCNISLILHLW